MHLNEKFFYTMLVLKFKSIRKIKVQVLKSCTVIFLFINVNGVLIYMYFN